jgi:hypothetical protein
VSVKKPENRCELKQTMFVFEHNIFPVNDASKM